MKTKETPTTTGMASRKTNQSTVGLIVPKNHVSNAAAIAAAGDYLGT